MKRGGNMSCDGDSCASPSKQYYAFFVTRHEYHVSAVKHLTEM